MKTIKLLQVMILGMMLSACGDKAAENKDAQPQLEAQNTTNENTAENKFLISRDSVGLFKFGDAWEDLAKTDYGYKPVFGFYDCECEEGKTPYFYLGSDVLVDDDKGTAKNAVLAIQPEFFEFTESKTEHKDNTDVFSFVSNPDIEDTAWYWKNKVGALKVYSDAFKTKEGIGVGSTLEELEKAMGKMNLSIVWVGFSGEYEAMVTVDAYPNIEFDLSLEDAIGDLNELSNFERTVTIKDFKPDTKIKGLSVFPAK